VDRWQGQGDIVRWWRTAIAEISQRDLAHRLSVRPSTLSNWESGARAISISRSEIDAAMNAGGALASLMWSVRGVDGLDARRRWSHVFPGASTPVWAWVRSTDSFIAVVGEWGVARLEYQTDAGPNGAFITLNSSVAESPIVMELGEPGWVEFGRGKIPSTIPGATVIDAATRARRSSANGPFMQMFTNSLTAKMSERAWTREMAAVAYIAPRTMASFFNSFGRLDDVGALEPIPKWPDGVDEVVRLKFARLRRARGLSLVETCSRLGHITDVEISKDTLRRFESDVGQPHDPVLPAALDCVLGAGGHLALLNLRSIVGSGLVTIPHWWHGPIWIAFEGSGDFNARIRWGDWYRVVRGTDTLVVYAHACAPEASIRVTVDHGFSWTIGLGYRPGAVSIDQNWVPANMAAAQRSIAIVEAAFLNAYGVGSEQAQ